MNKKYVGQTYEHADNALRTKYSNGVKFNNQGFSDFSPYSKNTVRVDGLTGNNASDFVLANKAAGYSQIPAGYTWHHVEDAITMHLVPTDLHQAVKHTGGASYLRYLEDKGEIK